MITLRSIASAVSVVLASVAFIATPAPPVYTISKKEQSNTVVLSTQRNTAEKKVTITVTIE